jgi:hypothetical protein
MFPHYRTRVGSAAGELGDYLVQRGACIHVDHTREPSAGARTGERWESAQLWPILGEQGCCACIYMALRWMNPTKGVAAMIFKSSHSDQFSM